MTGRMVRRPGVIAVFGGTFDPPHWGHVRAAEAVRDRMGVDAVWLVPARIPPPPPAPRGGAAPGGESMPSGPCRRGSPPPGRSRASRARSGSGSWKRRSWAGIACLRVRSNSSGRVLPSRSIRSTPSRRGGPRQAGLRCSSWSERTRFGRSAPGAATRRCSRGIRCSCTAGPDARSKRPFPSFPPASGPG